MEKIDENKINSLRENYENIELIIDEIILSKTILLEKIDKIKILYSDLIKKNNSKNFIFCLDSLHFQYKLFMMDIESINKIKKFTLNRMYCDYYKLYNIIFNDIKNQIKIKQKSYPIYNDLEIFYEYNLSSR